MSVPEVRALQNGRPDARITIAAAAKIAALWRLVPEVDVIFPFKGNSLLAAACSLRRRSSFDAAILFPNSLRVALESWLSGIPRRIGYRGHSRSWLLNQIILEAPRRGPLDHQSNRYLRLAHECGANAATGSLSLEKKTGDAQLAGSDQTLTTRHQTTSFGLCPGAQY